MTTTKENIAEIKKRIAVLQKIFEDEILLLNLQVEQLSADKEGEKHTDK